MRKKWGLLTKRQESTDGPFRGLEWESELHLGFPIGPFTSGVGHQSALEQIAQVRAMLNAMRGEENSLRSNLGIFKIEQPVSKDLQNLEKVGC